MPSQAICCKERLFRQNKNEDFLQIKMEEFGKLQEIVSTRLVIEVTCTPFTEMKRPHHYREPRSEKFQYARQYMQAKKRNATYVNVAGSIVSC